MINVFIIHIPREIPIIDDFPVQTSIWKSFVMFDWEGYIEVTSGWTRTRPDSSDETFSARHDQRPGECEPTAKRRRAWETPTCRGAVAMDKSGWHHVALDTMHMIIGTFINVFIWFCTTKQGFTDLWWKRWHHNLAKLDLCMWIAQF